MVNPFDNQEITRYLGKVSTALKTFLKEKTSFENSISFSRWSELVNKTKEEKLRF